MSSKEEIVVDLIFTVNEVVAVVESGECYQMDVKHDKLDVDSLREIIYPDNNRYRDN